MEKKLPFKKAAKKSDEKPAGEAAPIAGGEGNAAEAKAPAGKGPAKKGKAISGAAKKATVTKVKAPAKKKETKAPARPVRGGIQFICSECYEEFVLPADYSRETVTCPECLHVGKRPAEDFLRTVNLHKGGEKKALQLSLTIAEMLALAGIILVWALTPWSNSVLNEKKETVTLALLGIIVVLFIVLGLLISKYEKNRWEIYF